MPARLLLGLDLLAGDGRDRGADRARPASTSIGMLLVFVAVFILLCEHVLPMLIVRRNPERVLELLLPPFDYVARALHPLTGTLVRLLVEGRRDASGRAPQPATATRRQATRPRTPISKPAKSRG